MLFGGLPNEEEKSKINLSKPLFDTVPPLNYSRKHKRPIHKQIFCIEKHNFKGVQPWDFFGRNDAKAETPVLWPPHAKS